MEGVEGGTAAKGCIREVTVGRHVHGEHKRWEAHQHAVLISPIEAAATLIEMGVKAVKGHHNTGYMKGIVDENMLTVEEDDSRPATKDRDEQIIAHLNLKIEDGLV